MLKQKSPTRRSSLTPAFTFQEATGRYRNAAGKFVTRAAVRNVLDTALENSAKQAQALAEQLRQGQISLADWQRQMAREVKSVHLASAALAKGGWAEMSQSSYGVVGRAVRDQYAFLARFAAQVESGEQKLDGTLARRARLYIQAGRATYQQIVQREMVIRGNTEERSIRHASDSCSQCVSEAARGWVGIGELIPIGQRICLTQCKCGVEYRIGAET